MEILGEEIERILRDIEGQGKKGIREKGRVFRKVDSK